MVQLKGIDRLNSIWSLKKSYQNHPQHWSKTTYTQETHVRGIEMSPNTSAFFKANTGDSPMCAHVSMHKPVFDIFLCVGVVVDSSESEHGIVGRFHWAMTVLRAPTRFMRALAVIKWL